MLGTQEDAGAGRRVAHRARSCATHPLVEDMAKDVSATQAVEIARMQEVPADLEV